MNRKLELLVGLLLLGLCAIVGITLLITGNLPWDTAAAAGVSRAVVDAPESMPARPTPIDWEEINLTLVKPPSGELAWTPPNMQVLYNCPIKQVKAVIGADVAPIGGATVGNIIPDGPADKAGFKVGDRIIACGDYEIDCGITLRNYMNSIKPGEEMLLHVRRPIFEETINNPALEEVINVDQPESERAEKDRDTQ